MKKTDHCRSTRRADGSGTLPVSACAAAVEDTAQERTPALNTTEHMQYMNGYEDGTFRPDATITRAETCKLLAGLLVESAGSTDNAFTDVRPMPGMLMRWAR